MRNLFLLLLVSLFSLPVLAEKHALIIALGSYNKETDWSSISSANDVEIIKQALIIKGFSEENIHVYIDGLTKDGILNAIKSDLINKVKKGDVVYFHFSGHGQQVADYDGDELDGLDEALVPINAPARNKVRNSTTGEWENYNGDKHLRDEELGLILDELRIKLGASGNVMVVIDACHSGTATRGISKARGSKEPNVPDGWRPPSSKSRGEVKEIGFGLITTEANKAGMVCFSGSSQDELNYEYEENNIGYGSLSYVMSKALIESDNSTSYRALFENVKNKMAVIAPKQTPQVEGVIDQEILGGKLLGAANYFSVKHWKNDSRLEINAGKLHSVNTGSIVAFYPADTRDLSKAKAIAVGKVVSARTADSEVELTEGKLDKNNALSSWCFVREKNFDERKLKVQVIVSEPKDADVVKRLIKEYPILEFTEDTLSDLLVEIGGKTKSRGATISVVSGSDDVIFEKPVSYQGQAINEKEINEALLKMVSYSQALFLRELELDNPEMKAEVIIIPLKIRDGANRSNLSNEDFTELDPETLRGEDGVLRVTEGTFVRLKIKNNSSRTVYYSLIDIFPDNDLGILYPDDRRTAAEYKVKGFNESDVMNVFEIGPPYGKDVLKLILSEQPMDLSNVISTRGQSRGGGNPLESLFQNSFKAARGPKNTPVSAESIGIYTFTYEIAPSK